MDGVGGGRTSVGPLCWQSQAMASQEPGVGLWQGTSTVMQGFSNRGLALTVPYSNA